MSTTEPILGGMHLCRPSPLVGAGPFGLRLMSDLHIGASHVDYPMIQREIDDAVANEDRILINGDLLDLILPKDHKRYTPDAVHPRIAHRKDQVNAAVEWAVEMFAGAAHLIDMVGIGNHEAKTTDHHSIDPTALIVYELEKLARQKDPNYTIHYGGYTGFVDYRLRRNRERGARWVLYYHHGSGGNAPVTKGLIDFNRKDVFVDADMIWMGHKHNRLVVTSEKLRCPKSGDDIDVRTTHHVMTGAYFKTYVNQSQASVRRHGRKTNYAADAGLAPGGRGGVRVLLSLGPSDVLDEVKIIQ